LFFFGLLPFTALNELIRSCFFVGLIPNRLNASDPFSHPSGSSAVSPLAFSLKASPSGPQSRACGIQKTFSAGPCSFSF
jgi:hypothetical protein